jgi:hypothetical protein
MAGMAAINPEPVDPLDEEVGELLRQPAVKQRLDDFEARRREGRLGKGVGHDKAREAVGLPPRADPDNDG